MFLPESHFVLLAATIAATHWAIPLAAQSSVERDVSYVTEGSEDQRLDLFLPDAAGFPTVIFLHGGSLRENGERRSSELYTRVCEPFVGAGIGCANADYRLAPTHQWPAMPEDVAAAIKWVSDNIGSRGGDPERLFLFGHSSGCHLAAAVGTNPKYLEGVGLEPADLAGIIPMGCTLAPLASILNRAQALGIGMDSLRARWNTRPDDRFAAFDDRLDSDPSRFVGPHAPPALIVVAEFERFRPPILEQAARFVDLMYEAGRPADIVIVPGSHRSSVASLAEAGDPAFAAIESFIRDPGGAGRGSRPSSIR
ncbi:MAG: alpha/beta hydrolase [Myxococcota bacterium]